MRSDEGQLPRGRRNSRAKSADVLGNTNAASSLPVRVPDQWRWHYRVLLSLHGRLLEERRELRHVVAEQIEPHSMDEADSATDEFDHDLALSHLSAEQGALYEVSEALRRITNGTYGVCEETGKAIPAERLKAVPWTRFTREVEERLENKGLRAGSHLQKAGTVRENGQPSMIPGDEAPEMEEMLPPPNDETLSPVVSLPKLQSAKRRAK
jgi:RNA polymerase-binding transcription factor DksA